MSLRETWHHKRRAIVDLWKLVKSLPDRLERCEANLDAVRRVIDKDYDRTCKTQEACRELTRKIEMELFGIQHRHHASATQERLGSLVTEIKAKPPTTIRAPKGWTPNEDDDDD